MIARLGVVGGVVVALWMGATLMGSTAPAQAHATFTEDTAVADSEEGFALDVTVEREGAHNTEIVAEVPAGFEARYCLAEPGWSCATDNRSKAPTRFTWTRTAAPPTKVDYPSFEVLTPKKPGV